VLPVARYGCFGLDTRHRLERGNMTSKLLSFARGTGTRFCLLAFGPLVHCVREISFALGAPRVGTRRFPRNRPTRKGPRKPVTALSASCRGALGRHCKRLPALGRSLGRLVACRLPMPATVPQREPQHGQSLVVLLGSRPTDLARLRDGVEAPGPV